MGQAAGTAAALAVELDAPDIREVPAGHIRATLTADGMELDPRRHGAYAPHDTRLDDDDILPGRPEA